jgi:hypothetical protein
MNLRRLIRCWATLIVLCSLAFRVDADEESESRFERAKASFKAGAAAYAAGDYLAAIQALEISYELTPLPAIAFSLAQAERKQYFVSHDQVFLRRSVELFQRYLEQVQSGGRRSDALDALAQLAPLLPPDAQSSAAPPNAARPTRILVSCDARGASIELDGTTRSVAPLIAEVTPGKHLVTVRAPGFLDATRSVVAVSGELVLKEVSLHEQPSLLLLTTPSEVDVYVDGNYVSGGGQPVTLRMPSGVHEIAVGKKGYQVAHFQLELTRGEVRRTNVHLERTTQRTASLAMFVAGGALLGTSVGLNAFRVSAEDRAEEFLGRQRVANVSENELLRYNAAVVERNFWSTATSASLAAAAGLFIGGLFLHELDQPEMGHLRHEQTAPGNELPNKGGVGITLGSAGLGFGIGGVLHGQF